MKTLVILIILSLHAHTSYARHNHYEKHYQAIHCNNLGGVREARIQGGRIDCLTENYAIEHDFANKVYECIGQALYYGRYTNKIPVCALIVESGKSPEKAMRIFKKATTGLDIRLVMLYQDGISLRCESDVKELCNQ